MQIVNSTVSDQYICSKVYRCKPQAVVLADDQAYRELELEEQEEPIELLLRKLLSRVSLNSCGIAVCVCSEVRRRTPRLAGQGFELVE